jgi:hypothetical protein
MRKKVNEKAANDGCFFIGRGDWIFRLCFGLLALCAARALACATPLLKASHCEPFPA